MTLLKYRCESCSKTFYVDKTETPGQLKMSCPHCSNTFEGVKLAWMDDETDLISPKDIEVVAMQFEESTFIPKGDAIFYLANARMFKLSVQSSDWTSVPDKIQRMLLVRFVPPLP